MNDKKKILIVYHSGSGSTRTISEVLRDGLSKSFSVDMVQTGPCFDYETIPDYDLLIIGYPTYYFKPSISTSDFVEGIPVNKIYIQVFIFTTYGLYSGNSVRTLAEKLKEKNIIVSGYAQIRGPASDGVLLLPSFFRLFFRYERNVKIKVDKVIEEIRGLLKNPEKTLRIPLPRWYSPITRLFSKKINGIDYSSYKKNLQVLESRCTNCNICVDNCIRNCWTEGKDFPTIDANNCEFCLKCVHNCPTRAIIFMDKMKDNPRLDKSFYNELKQNTFLE